MSRALSSRLLVPTRSKLNEMVINTLLFPTSIPFTSSENAWYAPTVKEVNTNANKNVRWGTNLSYAHPETDWISMHTKDFLVTDAKKSRPNCDHLSFASIESDFCARYVGEPIHVKAPHPSLSHISFATPVSDFVGDHYLDTIPRSYTISEALAPSTEARVLTDANESFRIQHVNDAWTRLCGYTNEESYGKTLALIQGHATDKKIANDLVDLLRQGKSSEAVLINYDKWGRQFYNHLAVEPIISNDTGKITHFLGVLRDIDAKHLPSDQNVIQIN